MRAARFSAALLAAAACLVLAGCVDIYQSLSRDPSGSVSVYFSATVGRLLVDLVNSTAGPGQGISADSLLDPQDVETDHVFHALDARFTKIDDGINVGAAVRLHIDTTSPEDRDIMSAHDSPMVPDIGDTTIVISFPGGGMDPEDKDTLGGLITAWKYRLVISKDVMPVIRGARLTGEGVDYGAAVAAMIDSYLIEVPLALILFNQGGCELVISP